MPSHAIAAVRSRTKTWPAASSALQTARHKSSKTARTAIRPPTYSAIRIFVWNSLKASRHASSEPSQGGPAGPDDTRAARAGPVLVVRGLGDQGLYLVGSMGRVMADAKER